MEAYERARLEKNKDTTQTAVRIVWKKMKANFLTANELGKQLRRQANEGKIYRLQKGLKWQIFGQKLRRRKRQKWHTSHSQL